MVKLVDAFPRLATQLTDSLRAMGRDALAEQIDDALVERVTFDGSVNAGYIYLAPARALNVVEENVIGARHAETVTAETDFDTFLDVDNFDRLCGIEVLAPGVLEPELKRRASGA